MSGALDLDPNFKFHNNKGFAIFQKIMMVVSAVATVTAVKGPIMNIMNNPAKKTATILGFMWIINMFSGKYNR